MLINSDAARIRADAARIRADAARIRADAAEDQVRVAARERARQRVLEFFGRLPPPIWGTLFYFALSFTGAIYSWALYQQFDIQIFYFFSTPDFLLSAFQKLGLLSIGVGTTLFVIFMSAYLAYNSSIYRAFRRNKEEQRTLVYQEASIFLVILLAVPAGILLLFLWPWQDGGFNKSVLALTMLLLLGIGVLANHFVKFISPSGGENGPEQQSRDGLETGILLALLPTISLGIVLSWWFWRDNVFSEPVLPLTIPLLLGIGVLAYFAYHFIKLVYKSISGTRQQPLRSWQAGILPELLPVISLLIGIALSWWFRWDNVFSESVLPLTIPLLLGGGVLVCFAYHFTKLVRAPSGGVGQQALSRWQPVTLLGILLAVSLGGIPYYWGLAAGAEKKVPKDKDKDLVRVTIRQDVGRPQPHLPYFARLIGTTSNFHLFYECEKKTNNAGKKAEKERKCQEGGEIQKERVFIVPTANIASLQFNPAKDNNVSAEDAPIVAAINKINKAITRLNETSESNTDKVVAAINGIQIGPSIEMPDKIKLDLPEVVAAIGNVTAAVDALRSDPNLYPVIAELNATIGELNAYLKGSTTIAELNATIAELNATIRALNISGVVNSCAFGGELLGIIQPFQKGKHELESSEYGKLSAVFDKMKPHFENNTLYQLILVGRLSGEERRFSDAQRELAQARAEWVKKKILERFPGQNAGQIIPRLLPPEASLLRMSTDRDPYYDYNPYRYDLPRTGSVAVYACWVPKSEQASSSADSSP